MNKLIAAILLTLTIALPAFSDTIPATGTVDVHFSPAGGATAAIINELQAARSEILVQAYSFTSTPIAKALLAGC